MIIENEFLCDEIIQKEHEAKEKLHWNKLDAALTILGFSEEDKDVLEVASGNIDYNTDIKKLNSLKLHFLNNEKTTNYFKAILDEYDISFNSLNEGKSRKKYIFPKIKWIALDVEKNMIKEAEGLVASRKGLVQTLKTIKSEKVKQR